ncbi:MAG: hypothetical protein HQK55_07555 [Deltaproteobacteria bacterium]|nr:hypothetical protein [Deltaproteobacteria bacterium]
MKKLIVAATVLSFLMTGPAFAADKSNEAKAKAECQKAAKAEKIPKDKLKDYLKTCMEGKGIKQK